MYKKIKSYAKVNFALKVFKKNPGETKHQIDGLFYLHTKMYDEIYIQKDTKFSVTYFDQDRKNRIEYSDCLVKKILLYLQEKYHLDINYKILIFKSIPVGVGLGGGSSNAATVANYVISRSKEEISLDLKEIALQIGSDIPFFLSCYQFARVKEYGNIVVCQQEIKPSYKLYTCPIICSTTNVFKNLSQDEKYVSCVDVDKILQMIIHHQYEFTFTNDLTKYALQENESLRKKLSELHGFFTGSGSSIICWEAK